MEKLTIRIPDELSESINKYISDNDMKKSELYRKALNDCINADKKKKELKIEILQRCNKYISDILTELYGYRLDVPKFEIEF